MLFLYQKINCFIKLLTVELVIHVSSLAFQIISKESASTLAVNSVTRTVILETVFWVQEQQT